ncbi:MAG: DUF1727 domain-containing protein, partial [Acidimicrobiales bacterium]
PMVAWAAMAARSVTWVAAGQPWRSDAVGCPSCESRILYEGETWRCSAACGLERPDPEVWLEGELVRTGAGEAVGLRLALPGRFNRANAAMAAVAAGFMGVPLQEALGAMASVATVGGRYDVVRLASGHLDVDARLLLAKNPAGWAELLQLLDPAPTPVVVAINARIADGRDPSWLWDVPFEALRGRPVVACGERWRDLAVRLRYADVDHVAMTDALAGLVEVTGGGRWTGRRQPTTAQPHRASGGGDLPVRVDVIANYTAFQELRLQLARAGARSVVGRSPLAQATGGGG